MAKKIALIAGGMGAEAEVSRSTGQAFAKALTELGFDFTLIEADAELPLRLATIKPDVALLALHGKYGEDGTVQGICEYLRIPYSGTGVLGSALCMNKYYTKQVLTFHQIPTAKFQMFFAREQKPSDVRRELPLPVVVKPSREGSTVGISIVKEESDWLSALKLAAQYDVEVLIEEFIPGMELTVGVLGNKALTPIEIVPKAGFYDYKNKYTSGQTDYILPARLAPAVLELCQAYALKAHQVCQARVYSRVDFRVTPDGRPYVLELNTLPGCTPTSLLPKAAAHDGVPFREVIRTLVDQAQLDYAGVR